MIPQNTAKTAKEMRRQLEIEQEKIQKELATYYGWINQNQILFEVMLHKIGMKWKKSFSFSLFCCRVGGWF